MDTYTYKVEVTTTYSEEVDVVARSWDEAQEIAYDRHFDINATNVKVGSPFNKEVHTRITGAKPCKT